MNATHKLLRFGVFEVNLDTEELRKAGTFIKLAPQPFRLLAMLTTHAGQIVTREEIKEKLWGEETYVDFEQGMNHCIKQIRTVLGDNADNPLYIETLPRRGYRFLAPVVSKNVLAPAPKIIKSQSGIQSAIRPALSADDTAKGTEAPDRAEIPASDNQPELDVKIASTESGPATGVISVGSTQAAITAESPVAADKVTSATAAAEALAPEIARLRKSHGRMRRSLVWIVIVVITVVLCVLYWQLHRP